MGGFRFGISVNGKKYALSLSGFEPYSTHKLHVNWLPWSEFTMPGLPYFRTAFFNTDKLFAASRVFDRFQLTTKRLYKSMIAVRYINPLDMGMYVISIAHTWLGWLIFNPLSKYGLMYSACPNQLRFLLG